MIWSSSSSFKPNANLVFFFPCGLKASKKERKKEGRSWEAYVGGGTFLLDGLQHLWGLPAFCFFLHKQVHNENELYSQILHIYSQALKAANWKWTKTLIFCLSYWVQKACLFCVGLIILKFLAIILFNYFLICKKDA